MHCLVFTDTDFYSLMKGKAYLANKRWHRSTCLRDQCYDVGCYPWISLSGVQDMLFQIDMITLLDRPKQI